MTGQQFYRWTNSEQAYAAEVCGVTNGLSAEADGHSRTGVRQWTPVRPELTLTDRLHGWSGRRGWPLVCGRINQPADKRGQVTEAANRLYPCHHTHKSHPYITQPAMLCKAKRQYLLTCKVSRYCLLALHDRLQSHLGMPELHVQHMHRVFFKI